MKASQQPFRQSRKGNDFTTIRALLLSHVHSLNPLLAPKMDLNGKMPAWILYRGLGLGGGKIELAKRSDSGARPPTLKQLLPGFVALGKSQGVRQGSTSATEPVL